MSYVLDISKNELVHSAFIKRLALDGSNVVAFVDGDGDALIKICDSPHDASEERDKLAKKIFGPEVKP